MTAKELLADVAREQLEQLPNFDRHMAVLERRLLGLLEAGEAMQREGQRLVDWLDKLAMEAEREAKDNRFITLKEAYAADAKNFRATAMAMRGTIKLAAIAKAVASEGKKRG